ncbi:tRNA (guanosine(46)-N7)-methyltransferase TrmB [Alteribacillus sp. HJP-4]|uniref:tRNA (guanosine(46)-N7)-methyltransferase TrmB n=1 Tax=Alteribacillus sp. HJP-4 TaxID=2775394 RepID=UPI0035CD3348
MRLRHKPWAKELLESHPEYIVPSPEEGKGCWNEIFSNNRPIHVEVGTGKGKFLTNMCEKYPDINFIGIEKYESVLVTGLQRILEKEVKPANLRFINGDAADFPAYFENNELDRIFINFTDPWPKKRHEKRRLTYKDFLDLYKAALKPGAELHMKTDNEGLFEYSLESMSEYGLKLKNISLNLHQSDWEDNVMTEYEEKFYSRGERIFRVEAVYPNDGE